MIQHMIDILKVHFPKVNIGRALIKNDNMPSMKMTESCGFQKVDQNGEYSVFEILIIRDLCG